MTPPRYYCASCGKEHAGLPTDWGFGLPDAVYTLTYLERYLRARHNADLCALDESRYFIRGIVLVPLTESDGQFGWGFWAEVERDLHDLYVDGFDRDQSAQPRRAGRLANDIPGYSPTVGAEIEIEFRGATDRPLFWFPEAASHGLAHEQRGGISAKRQHDILRRLGYFDDDED